MILLDTCAFLWLVNDYSALSPTSINAIKQSNQLFISPISALEITIKHKNGKLKLPNDDVNKWYHACIKHWQLTEFNLNSEILISSAQLPPIHKDPFDRIIVATALKHKAKIITSDTIIPQYPDIDVIW